MCPREKASFEIDVVLEAIHNWLNVTMAASIEHWHCNTTLNPQTLDIKK